MFTHTTKLLRRTVVSLSWLLLLQGPALGQDLSGIPGAFSDAGLGAGPMGKGNAVIALGQNVYSILANPAGLVNVSKPEAVFSSMKQYSLIPYNLVLYGQSWGDNLAIGGGFLTAGDEALRENTVYIALARKFRTKYSAGFNFKFRQASFGNNAGGAWLFGGGNRQVQGSATGFAFDLGVRGDLNKQLSFAIVLKDLISGVNYDASNTVGTAQGGSEGSATTFLLGIGYVSNRNLTAEINLQKSISDETSDRLSLGLEKSLFSIMALRLGFSQNIAASEAREQIAFGTGIKQKIPLTPLDFSLDFAYLLSEINNFYHVGLRLIWARK